MLSAPAKSAKRITSLLSLGSSKDNSGEERSKVHRRSADLNHPPPSRSQNPPLRHAASAQHLAPDSSLRQSTASRNVSTPLPSDSSNDEYLAPPPSLATLNPDMSDPHNSHRRSQSAGGNVQNRASSPGRPDAGPPAAYPGSRPGTPDGTRLAKGLSWVPGKARQLSRSVEVSPARSMRAWIAGANQDIPYDIRQLAEGKRLEELWDDQADTFVYLFPKEAGKPPSFKVDSTIFAASPSLTFLARGSDPLPPSSNWPARHSSRQQLGNSSSPPVPPKVGWDYDSDGQDGRRSREVLMDDVTQELHLYLPIPLDSDVSSPQTILHDDDIDMLVLFRNLFAFLIGQSLVATPRFPSIFSIFMEVAGLLSRFEFSNLDGSTFGETAHSSFACYCDELVLTDTRKSREKTLDAIVLGERMRYLPLYQEGYTHGIGKLDDIKALNSGKYSLISSLTQKRMERGFIDLDTRLRTVRGRLEDFDFPSLFAGIANSNSANESKIIRFKNWKNAYLAFRKHIMSYYRTRFGSWPPKARSKKNSFEESGLNRVVLKELYGDLTNLYDMLVNRASLTTRSADMTSGGLQEQEEDVHGSFARALRQVMSEYDRSTPPVQPPIPFDTPLLPDVQSIHRKQLDPKKLRSESSKRLKSGETNEILVNSYNRSSMKPTPFLEEFIRFERRAGQGKSCDELADNRCGQWLFMYAVIQALPMVVVDAANVSYSDGVEYFVCIPPRGGSPWCREDTKPARSWFGVAGGSGVVNLPSDVVTHGVEGVYRRSHCWQVAAKWADEQDILSSAMDHLSMNQERRPPAMPPPPPLSSTNSSSDRHQSANLTPPTLSLPPGSPMGRAGNRASINIGLEALPLPSNVMSTDAPSRSVNHNPTASFDRILQEMPKPNKK